MDRISAIKEAIQKADRLESKLVYPATDVPSFTSMKIRHLLNSLGAISKNYLEVGSHKGGHFCSTLYKNENIFEAVAIDDYSEFYVNGETREEFFSNCSRFIPKAVSWSLIEQDCFSVKLQADKFDLFNYDAQHTESSQQRAVTYFHPFCTQEFIMVVDDWSFNGVEAGTRNGIKLAGLEILFEQILITPQGEPPNDYWHNNFAVFLLKKTIK